MQEKEAEVRWRVSLPVLQRTARRVCLSRSPTNQVRPCCKAFIDRSLTIPQKGQQFGEDDRVDGRLQRTACITQWEDRCHGRCFTAQRTTSGPSAQFMLAMWLWPKVSELIAASLRLRDDMTTILKFCSIGMFTFDPYQLLEMLRLFCSERMIPIQLHVMTHRRPRRALECCQWPVSRRIKIL